MIKKLAYLSVLTSLLGASIVSINLNVFQLSIFRVLIILILFIMVSKLLLGNGTIKFSRKSRNNYSIKFMLFWLTYGVLSLGWVLDYGEWVRAIYFLGLGVLCVVIYNKAFYTSKDILNSFRILAIMIIFHNFIGWYEIITGNYLFLTNSQEYYARFGFPVSMFNNTNNFATFMLISLFILYICIVNSKVKIVKIIYIIAAVSSVYLLIMTTSRANILGLILAVGVFVYLSMKNKKRRLGLLIILTMSFGVTLLFPGFYNTLILTITQNLNFNFSDSGGSDSIRQNLVKNGFHFLLNSYGFGTGAGNVEYWMANEWKYYTHGIVNIHNWWLDILIGYGILIFTLYVVFFLKLFRDLYRIYKTSKNNIETTISLGIMCSMAGYAIGSISSSSNISSEWLWVFWGLVIAFQGNSGTQSRDKVE